VIVAGFGFRGGAGGDSGAGALAATGRTPQALAAPMDKAPALAALAATLGVPVIGVAPEALAAVRVLTDSPASRAARGTGSVAEASALAAAGPGARLLGPRVVSADRMATCALAEGDGR